MASSASAGHVASAVLDPCRRRALALPCGAYFKVLLDGTITIPALPFDRKPAHELPEPDPAVAAAASGDVVIRPGTK